MKKLRIVYPILFVVMWIFFVTLCGYVEKFTFSIGESVLAVGIFWILWMLGTKK